MDENQDKYSIDAFPIEFEATDESASLSAAANTIFIIAGCVFAIAACIIIFGPSSIKVSYSGPTFTQFWLLYPGPIATLAGLAIFGGQQLKNKAINERNTTLERHITEIAGANLEKLPDGYTLNLNKQGSDTYQLNVVPVEEMPDSTQEEHLSQAPDTSAKREENV
ncbi:hypothetical protein [Vreelandella sp. EE7]